MSVSPSKLTPRNPNPRGDNKRGWGLWDIRVEASEMMGFPSSSMVKNLLASAGVVGLIPELGRSPGGGNGNPLQYSCLENPLDSGA